MTQAATTPIFPLALRPLLRPGGAVTADVEVAAVTGLGADTEGSDSGERVTRRAHAKGQLEHALKADNILGVEAMEPGELHCIALCELCVAPSLKTSGQPR